MWAVRGMCPLWSVMCTIWTLCGASKELWFRNFQKSVWCRTLQIVPLRAERDSCLCDLDLSSWMCSILLTKHFCFHGPTIGKTLSTPLYRPCRFVAPHLKADAVCFGFTNHTSKNGWNAQRAWPQATDTTRRLKEIMCIQCIQFICKTKTNNLT